ncbi:sigma-70 family RNA polymerase sigma factor [cf. Phormidesmis sp. LEGE 11477]|uniref:sigma-70 family RNA polymerase sigma factor n=1 Tax=cf. Phormidesmis sp. LEGE 11477 TaxID=1828680 RepID=UPI00187E9014|nr:sigma-70 family RNA polymerase sigma factor [cf. Phormidesmis sp. LEGE 11477]MBE9060715.1 sigma-70 family RNA polymerase sigma factor [cf. Phormidesmis sp. LEGE 11477]
MDSAPSNQYEYNSQTDTALWEALCAGDSAALGQLYDRHASLVYGISLNMLGNTQEAEDLTQDIFIKIVESKRYDPTRGSLRTFLAVLTRSRSLDRLRSRQSARRSQQKLESSYAASPNTSLDPATQNVLENEQSETVRTALSQLSVAQRQALQLAYYDGLSQSDIASRLNAPLGTIKARTRRGLLKLRDILTTQAKGVRGENLEGRIDE